MIKVKQVLMFGYDGTDECKKQIMDSVENMFERLGLFEPGITVRMELEFFTKKFKDLERGI